MPGITLDFARGMVDDMYKYAWEGEQYDDMKMVGSETLFREEKKQDGSYYQTTSVVGMSALQETPETEGYKFRQPTEGYTVISTPWDFTDGISLTNDAIKDHAKIKNLLRESSTSWGRSKKTTIEKFLATFFNKGGFTAGHKYFSADPSKAVSAPQTANFPYDSVPFFSFTATPHLSKKGDSYANRGDGTTDLSLILDNIIKVYKTAIATNNRDENDEIIPMMYDTLLVPGGIGIDAERELNSTLYPGKADNDKNPLKGKFNIVEWQFLTNSSSWYLGKAKKGIFQIDWQDIVMDFFEDKPNRQWKATSELRHLAGIDNWRFWYAGYSASS